MERLAEQLGVKQLSKSQVSEMHALLATGVNADGHREILGLEVATAEDGAGWLAFLGELAARTGTDLLDVIDVALQLDETFFEVDVIGMEADPAYSPAVISSAEDYIPQLHWPPTSLRARAVARLAQLLGDGGSAYTVHWRVPLRLVHRVDPTSPRPPNTP